MLKSWTILKKKIDNLEEKIETCAFWPETQNSKGFEEMFQIFKLQMVLENLKRQR